MKTETAQKKFGEWLLQNAITDWDGVNYKHWRTTDTRYTGVYTTEEMFTFFKTGKLK